MRLLAGLLAVLPLLVTTALSNTEKTIFVTPPSIKLPATGPSLEALALDIISPTHSSRRASLPVAFPSEAKPRGRDHWYLLQALNGGQRYEVRICWVATAHPTEFALDVHTVTHVLETPSLMQSLSSFSEPRGPQDRGLQHLDLKGTILLLHVQSAADFFTTNETLMQHPPVVDVDIILDPYLANVFPRSLVPTALYLLIVALGAWFVSGAIWTALNSGTPEKQHHD